MRLLPKLISGKGEGVPKRGDVPGDGPPPLAPDGDLVGEGGSIS